MFLFLFLFYCFSQWISPSRFFKSTRGFRQGYPFNTLLFILVMEGFSRFIDHVKLEKFVNGVKVMTIESITHFLFVDDVLYFGNGIVDEWIYFMILSCSLLKPLVLIPSLKSLVFIIMLSTHRFFLKSNFCFPLIGVHWRQGSNTYAIF